MIKDTAVQILLEHFSEGMVRTIVDAIAEDERKACADIAENWRCNGMPRTGVANEIRARGKE